MTRIGRLIAGILLSIVFIGVFPARKGEAPNRPETPPPLIMGAEKKSALIWPRNTKPLRVLVVFTKFKGESPGDSLASPWAAELFDGKIGSVNDYFKAVSFGEHEVLGEYLPRVYEMPNDSTYYKKDNLYTLDVLRLLDKDPSFSFANYDNDGPDGKPNSGDDDGYVDYLVLMPRSRPYNFIFKLATGVMSLPLLDDFTTEDRRPLGTPIIADDYSGAIAVAASKYQAISILTAEIAHAFGAVDLMDKEYALPETDSAGAGFWDVLAWGANGWDWSGVPVPPGAYNRILMGCAGPGNSNIVDIYGASSGLRLRDTGDPRGKIYRIMISPDEYFLIEHRNNSGSLFYDYQLPRSGILIWHISERESNATEDTKLCDLECADGKFRDAGFPKGLKPDPLKGGDNLDFWAHDSAWTVQHNGNMGDATDVYDGVTYTKFGEDTNPNSRANQNLNPSNIEIFNIRREGEEMVFDCIVAYNPIVLPPRLPIVSMGYQRSKNRTPVLNTTVGKTVYLASRTTAAHPDLLAAVSEDSLYTVDVSNTSRAEVQKSVDSFLLEGMDLKGVQVVRENIPVEELDRVLGEVSARPAGPADRPFRAVQKLVLRREAATIPFVMAMYQNHPNPFNAVTTIPYILSETGPVTLEIFDILGRKVMSRDEGYKGAGSHTALFSAGGLASGVYFYRIKGVPFSQTRRFVVLR